MEFNLHHICMACGKPLDQQSYWLVVFGNKPIKEENAVALCDYKCYLEFKNQNPHLK